MDRLVTLLSFISANFLRVPEVGSECHVPIICCDPRWFVVDISILRWFVDLLKEHKDSYCCILPRSNVWGVQFSFYLVRFHLPLTAADPELQIRGGPVIQTLR